jgi:hypothetical protein
VRFGREAARVALRGNRAGVPLDLEVTLSSAAASAQR